jgi:hypothetical protein
MMAKAAPQNSADDTRRTPCSQRENTPGGGQLGRQPLRLVRRGAARCVFWGPPMDTVTSLDAERRANYAASHRRAVRAYYRRQRALGRCTCCGGLAGGKAYCAGCAGRKQTRRATGQSS